MECKTSETTVVVELSAPRRCGRSTTVHILSALCLQEYGWYSVHGSYIHNKACLDAAEKVARFYSEMIGDTGPIPPETLGLLRSSSAVLIVLDCCREKQVKTYIREHPKARMVLICSDAIKSAMPPPRPTAVLKIWHWNGSTEALEFQQLQKLKCTGQLTIENQGEETSE